MTTADRDRLFKPVYIPPPGSKWMDDAALQRMLARAAAEGRDLTDAEFWSFFGLSASPAPASRRLAVSELRAYLEIQEKDLAKLTPGARSEREKTREQLATIVALLHEREQARELIELITGDPNASITEATAVVHAEQQQRARDDAAAMINRAYDDGRIRSEASKQAAFAFFEAHGLEALMEHLSALVALPKGARR